MSGAWVFVCGPSGAGKDSVIAWARQALGPRSDIVFARRLITRPDPVGSDHEPVTDDQFDSLLASAGLVWHWEAHGFRYGIPMRYAHQVAWGRVVVVNGSREHMASVATAPDIRRVLVTAPAQELATRLTLRQRDDPHAISGRIARNAQLALSHIDLVIENDGALATAGATLKRLLESLDHAHAASA